MHHPLDVPGFEDRQLSVVTAGLWSSATLYIDGTAASKGPKRREFLLRRNDGEEVTVQLRFNNPFDPLPQLVVGQERYLAAEPLHWYEWLWVGLPSLLLVVGGALGGLCGGIALGLNGRLFRADLTTALKYLGSGIVTSLAVLCYFVSATLVGLTIKSLWPATVSEFRSLPGNFSIMTPYRLEERVQSLETEAGKIDLHMFSGGEGECGYTVGYSDYPVETIQSNTPAQLLDKCRDGAVSNVKGILVSEVNATLDGHPGREVIITSTSYGEQGLSLHERFFLVNGRLYQVLVVSPIGQKATSRSSEFMNSFKLIHE